nr:hypothetical protein [bacterium]
MKERASERWPDEEPSQPETGPVRRAKRRKRADREEPETRETPEAPEGPERIRDRQTDVEAVETGESPGVEDGPLSEAARRRLAAETAFRRRVALAELEEKLSDKAYAAVRDVLQRSGGQWHLERGHHLLHRLVSETTVGETEPSPVRGVSVKLATRRESEPVMPRELAERVTAACQEPAGVDETVGRIAAAAEALPPEDDLSVTVETADKGEVRVEVTVDAVRAIGEQEGGEVILEERPRLPQPEISTEDPATPENIAAEGGIPILQVEDASDGMADKASSVLEPVPAVAREFAAEVAADLETIEDEPTPPEPRTPLGKAVEQIEAAWWETEVPPIAGGSPELDDMPEQPD